ncbi:single-pass membrane and coiled-coil domain-containing protein 4 isoform X2 [Scleropages formosus]|uniref:single-pass membrane and coiled-coil domain-containing protein 4 isoform X2 n=1 Tax=Scleropages formosus TaxID=113540 RepID=UPI0010FAB6E0|nr:single-pass membrane and coiled-coil domain-containing protein 4 isoform X2 [Scleropages formosus]
MGADSDVPRINCKTSRRSRGVVILRNKDGPIVSSRPSPARSRCFRCSDTQSQVRDVFAFQLQITQGAATRSRRRSREETRRASRRQP